MGGTGNPKESIMELNIVPLAISYEFDPCDFLKAQEFQLKRDTPDYKKTRDDDIFSMKTGMFGYKGHIHYQAGESLNKWLECIPDDTPKNEFFTRIAHRIDHIIHSNYRIYANNYIAADMLKGEDNFKNLYSTEEKERFCQYLQTQLNRITLPQPDYTFLKQKMLEMYANPLYNHLKAKEQ